MRSPVPPVIQRWADGYDLGVFWVPSVTTYEVSFGLGAMPEGRRRDVLTGSYQRLIYEVLKGRIAPLDDRAATQAGTLAATRKRAGRSQALADTLIAGTALARRATIATRNTRHFADLDLMVVDPWTG